MIFKQRDIVAVLFIKIRSKCFTEKHLQARTSHGLFLSFEALGEKILRP